VEDAVGGKWRAAGRWLARKVRAGMNREDSHGVGLSRRVSVAHMAKKDVL
jgi:hypothetical protein